MNEREQRIAHIIAWLRQQVHETKTNGLTVGISGGVDSAVVAFLIKQAFPDHSLGVIMPCHSNPEDEEDALKVAEASGIDHIVVDLSDTHDHLLHNLQIQLSEKDRGKVEIGRLVDGNLRARLRMSTLYAVANHYHYLVAGTDNAAEWYTGYFTKYGDGGVDLLPIARLPKRDVYRWAEYFGVPASVMERSPSAGLWDGQNDETELGTTYDKIDDLLAGKSIPDEDRRKIVTMYRRTEHKRTTPSIPPEFP